MKKWAVLSFAILIVGLAGCHSTPSAQPASRQALNHAETIWHDIGSWTAGKYTAQAASVAPTVVVTRHGLAVGSTALTYAQAKTAIRTQSSLVKPHWFTLKQLNAGLAKAKAGFVLKQLTDLTFYRTAVTPAPTTGYVARGKRLYAIEILATGDTAAKLPAITVYASAGRQPQRVATSDLAGRWVGADGRQLRVIGDKLYQNATLGASRQLIQPLRKVAVDQLYSATYLQHLAVAAQRGYRLTRATTTLATDGSTLYVFLSKQRMVALSSAGSVTFTKTNRGQDTSQVKADILKVFAAADARRDLLPAISVADIGSSHYEVACHAFSMLTDPYASKDIDWQKATLVNQRVTITDMYPELK